MAHLNRRATSRLYSYHKELEGDGFGLAGAQPGDAVRQWIEVGLHRVPSWVFGVIGKGLRARTSALRIQRHDGRQSDAPTPGRQPNCNPNAYTYSYTYAYLNC